MHVDSAIKDAIQQAVAHHEQPEAISEKLVKWLDEVVSGNESMDSEESVYKRLDNLVAAIEGDAEEEEE
ncbi:MAG: hypothetical protein DWQ29_04805 [Planctomycetota bacterium]|nr:MAG: hypothetical protein DWQ29_04805 [Planctomycetota bacterium]